MFHYTKSFGTFARAYGIQEGSGLPELHQGVIPVSIIDETQEYVKPTYPVYTARGSQAGVAAVYGLIGLSVPPNGNPIRILDFFGESTNSSGWSLGITDRRTVAVGTFVPAGLVRGQAAPTTLGLEGTTTVAPLGLDSTLLLWAAANVERHTTGLQGLVLRPGEYLWASTLSVNDIFVADFMFEELLFPLPAVPAAL